MSATQLRGLQLRLGTLPRDRIDPAFEASLAAIESNVASIFSTMSTDAERIAAVEALTTAFQNADGTLQGAITALVNATKLGAGLEADGTLSLGVTNYLTGSTSLKAAAVALDAALKVEADARIAADAALTTSINTLVAGGASDAAAALAVETAARIAADGVNAAAVAAEEAARIAADTAMQLEVDNEVAARILLNTTLSQAIADEATARTDAVSSEATTRASADTTLQNNIAAEALARANADTAFDAALTAEASTRATNDTAEATAREAADTALDTRIDVIEAAVVSNLTYDKLVVRETPVGVIDGVNAVFTLANTPYAGTETVFLNGMMLEPGAANDYQLVGQEITLAAAPLTGDRVKVSYFR